MRNGQGTRVRLILLVSSLAWMSAESLAQEAGKSTVAADGIYTSDQATRGRAAFAESCSSCHLDDLSGTDRAPALAGDAFVAAWEDLSVGDLFDRIQNSMPQDKPGTLTSATTADIVGYVLQANEYPAGKADLATDSKALKMISLKKK